MDAQLSSSPDSVHGQDLKMRSDKGTFRQLLQSAADGSDEAIQELVDRYGGAIRLAVRKHLSDQLRRQFDSEDLMQTVWKSFFARPQFCDQFETPEKLGAFLSQVARNKVVEKYRRYHGTQSFSMDREQTATDLNPNQPHDGIANTPTPSQIASAKETAERIMSKQPDHWQQAIELKAAGLTYEEIGEKLGFNKDSVRRIITKARKKSQEER